MGNFGDAEAVWQQALVQDASNGLVDTALIEMKISDLPSGDTGDVEQAPAGVPEFEGAADGGAGQADEPQAESGEEPGE